ncbi:MAG: tetratricopeptide repeat protein [Rikenellaceae bacterium]
MNLPQFKPTALNTYIIVHPENMPEQYDFALELSSSRKLESAGDIEGACNVRFKAFQCLIDLIPDEDEVVLDWEDENSQAALAIIHASAIDHFLAGDFEMSAGMMEILTDLDPEDHFEGTKVLAYNYVALEEYELFDEIINDVSDKYAEKDVLKMWSDFRRDGGIVEGELRHFKRSFPFCYQEFISAEHPIDQEYLSDIESEHPTRPALARELWLQTEHLWLLYPEFIVALRKTAE